MKFKDIQLDFLLRACNLYWAILQFDITDKDFKEDYGYSKEEAIQAICHLERQFLEENM
jgi:hypothetical protein